MKNERILIIHDHNGKEHWTIVNNWIRQSWVRSVMNGPPFLICRADGCALKFMFRILRVSLDMSLYIQLLSSSFFYNDIQLLSLRPLYIYSILFICDDCVALLFILFSLCVAYDESYGGHLLFVNFLVVGVIKAGELSWTRGPLK